MLSKPVVLCVYFFFLFISSTVWFLLGNCVYFAVVFPVQHPAATNSSSSEDEAGQARGTVIRRRRLRKNTTSVVTEPEEEEKELESGQSEEEEDEGQHEEQADVRPAALDVHMRGQGSNTLNTLILIALIVAISMGFGHFYGEKFTAELQDFTHIFNTENKRNVHIWNFSKIYIIECSLSVKDKIIPLTLN